MATVAAESRASLHLLHTLELWDSIMPVASFGALRACLSLAHLEVYRLPPPPDSSVGTLGSLPPVLQQLCIKDRISIAEFVKMPLIAGVGAGVGAHKAWGFFLPFVPYSFCQWL